jgi:hypothetical protein
MRNQPNFFYLTKPKKKNMFNMYATFRFLIAMLFKRSWRRNPTSQLFCRPNSEPHTVTKIQLRNTEQNKGRGDKTCLMVLNNVADPVLFYPLDKERIFFPVPGISDPAPFLVKLSNIIVRAFVMFRLSLWKLGYTGTENSLLTPWAARKKVSCLLLPRFLLRT